MKKVVFLLFVNILLLSACSGEGLLDKFLKGGDSSVPVKVENIIVRERAYEVRVPAIIKPSEKVQIKKSDKVKVEKVFIKRGDTVNKGEELFTTTTPVNTTSAEELTTSLKEARADLEKNNYLFENRDRLIEEERIDQNQYDMLEDDIDESEAMVEKLQVQINALKEAPESTRITAPIGGVVSDVKALVGMTVPAGEAMAEITQVDPVSIEFELESYEASTVQPGMSIEVKLPDLSGERLRGTITKIGKSIDPGEQTFKVWASVPNRNGYLKVGMSAEVEFKSDKKQRFLLIPTDALIRERRRYYVFTVLNGAAHRVEVVPKEKQGDKTEIAKGLRETDLVITKGHEKLKEGAAVEIWGR